MIRLLIPPRSFSKKISDHLESYEKKADEPENEKFLQALILRGYKKGTKEYEFYWKLQGWSKEFAQSHLDKKKMDVYPYVTVANADGHTNLKEDGSGFDLYVDLGKLSKNEGKDRDIALFDTWAHEVAHDVVFLKESKKLLDEDQYHSKPFWEELYVNEDSTLAYLNSCLSPEEQQRLKILTNLSIDTSITDARLVYFPDELDWKNKTRKKRYFKEEEITEGWNSSRQLILKLADDSMNKDDEPIDKDDEPIDKEEKWGSKEERENRWVRAVVLHKRRELTQEDAQNGKKEHKIYIFYNELTAPSELKGLIEKEFSPEKGWKEKEVIIGKKTTSMGFRIEEETREHVICGCGRENISEEISQQEAKIVDNPPFKKN